MCSYSSFLFKTVVFTDTCICMPFAPAAFAQKKSNKTILLHFLTFVKMGIRLFFVIRAVYALPDKKVVSDFSKNLMNPKMCCFFHFKQIPYLHCVSLQFSINKNTFLHLLTFLKIAEIRFLGGEELASSGSSLHPSLLVQVRLDQVQ